MLEQLRLRSNCRVLIGSNVLDTCAQYRVMAPASESQEKVMHIKVYDKKVELATKESQTSLVGSRIETLLGCNPRVCRLLHAKVA